MIPDLVVCDLDGVVYLGDEPVEGAGEALGRLEALGLEVVLCTNNSSRTRAQTAAKVERLTGYPATAAQVLSSALAAAEMVAGAARRVVVLGGEGIVEALAAVGVEPAPSWRTADHVVVGVDFELTYRRLADAVLAVRAGARLVATNHDPTYPTPEGLLPGAGAVVAAVETASGRRAVFAGKPFPPMRQLIRRRAGGRRVWVVGDRPDTDLTMATEEGWEGVLVLTGVATDATGLDPAPTLVLPSIADLPGAIAQTR